MSLTHGLLHHTILSYIVLNGYAPTASELASLLHTSEAEIKLSLRSLQEYHGIVLHPDGEKIWVVHPFSLAPTNFIVSAGDKMWWGNCAWCSLGIAVLLHQSLIDCVITTSIGAHGEKLDIHISGGEIVETDILIHFPIPMRHAWDNVIYTCSTMLMFRTEGEIQDWSLRHRIPVGDIQSIEKIWKFAREWYGDHLNPGWVKWNMLQAQDMFTRHGLTHDVWQLGCFCSKDATTDSGTAGTRF